jgi:AraC-like DNA-binding protein
LTAPQVAARFGIETTNVTAWGRSGRLAGRKALGTWRFPLEVVDAFARMYLGVTDAQGNLVDVNIDECWTVDELAQRSGKSPSTLRRAAGAGKLTAYKHRDRWHFDPSDSRVQALVEI